MVLMVHIVINLWLAAKSDWLLSPQFDLTGGPFQVDFDFGIMQFGSNTAAGTLGSDDTVQLFISTDNGATWVNLLTFDSTSVIPATGTQVVADLTAYSGMTVQFGIYGSEGTVDDAADNEVFVDNFRVRTIPSCQEPTGLSFANLSDTTADLSWTAGGTETTWEVAVQPAGTGIPTGAGTATTVNNPYVATILTPSTAYEAYVRADCGANGFSVWIGPVNFTTLNVPPPPPVGVTCPGGAASSFVVTEEFDDVNGWTGNINGGNGTWEIPNDSGSGGTGPDAAFSGAAFMNYEASGGTTALASAITPGINLTTATDGAELSFYMHAFGADMGTLNVGVSTSATGPFTNLYTWIGEYQTSGADPWVPIGINLDAYLGQIVYVEFSYAGTGGFEGDMSIDYVRVETCGSFCIAPSMLAAANITDTSADISWVPGGAETGWEIVIQPAGTGVPPGPGTPTTTNNPYLATTLTSSTAYEVYIRSDCGALGFSSWAGPLNFTTLNTPPPPPVGVTCATGTSGIAFTEDFETDPAAGWTGTAFSGNNGDWDITGPAQNSFGTGPATAYDGGGGMHLEYEASGNSSTIASAISPAIDLSLATDGAELAFWMHAFGADIGTLNVGVSNSATGPFTNVYTWIGDYQAADTEAWVNIGVNLDAYIGQVIYLEFSYGGTGTGFEGDMSIDQITVEACGTLCDQPPTATFTIIDDCANGNQFLVDVDVTDIGNATTIEITDNQGSAPITVTTTGITQVGPYPFATDIIITVNNADFVSCAAISDPLQVLACPPPNDNCVNATSFNANADATCTNNISGTLLGATASAEANICAGTANDDVWFSFIALSTDHAIDISNIVGTTNFLSHGLYEGPDCNSLTNIYCSIDNQSIANGLVVGNTYYIRIFSFDADPFQDVTFDLCVITIPPPITTDITLYTVPELVEDILIDSPCSLVSNITWSTGTDFGATNGIGYFESNGSSFPFASGIVMTTGDVLNAPGPEAGTLSDGGGGWPGDADLEAVINEGPTNNASIIEFDFTPQISTMSFDFIFAAEEYGQFQCGFSDAFAFLLTDLTTGVTTNIALVPGTTDPVSVFTIRDDTYNGACPSANPALFGEYYDVPDYANGIGLNPLTSPTDFRGRTVPLTAMSTVIPNNPYHIKLVVADDGDTLYDSAVFLSAGSFDIGTIDLGADILLTGGNANCEGDEVILDMGVAPPANTTITWYLIENGIFNVIAGETGTTLSVTETGTYLVEIVFNGTSCFFSDEILVEFFPIPDADPSPVILSCDTNNDDIAIFDLTQNNTIITAGAPDVTVTFYETMTDAEDAMNAIANPTMYQNTSNPQTIYARVEDDITGCFKTTSFDIELAPKPIIAQGPDIVGCDNDDDNDADYDLTENETIIANGLSGLVFSYYLLLDDAVNSNAPIADPQNYESAATTIYVRAEDPNGCFETTSFDLIFGLEPSSSFDSSIVYEVCPNATVPIEVTAIADNYALADVSIRWLNDGVEVPGQTGLVLPTVLTQGTYTIEVTFNDTGCIGMADVQVIEFITCVIPQGISPNNDGFNDTFDLSSYDVQSLEIFNRNGTKVYSKTSYLDEWHGQSDDGDQLPVGTYFYVMKYQGDKVKTAWVYINREQ